MRLSEAIGALVTATMSEGRSHHTISGYRRDLGHLVEFLGDVEITTITLQDLRSYSASLRTRSERYSNHPLAASKPGGLSPFTVASYLRCVKRLFNFLADEDLLSTNPAAKLKNPTPTRREPKAISVDDFRKMLAATVGAGIEVIRDRAIVLFLGDTGCRAGRITHLRLGDIDMERATARLLEKGDRTRIIPISVLTIEAISAWLAVRPTNTGTDWLFVNLGPKKKEIRLTEDALGEVLRRLGKRAGVTGAVNPHSWRHAFAREWLRNRGDLATLARILGHADMAVTARFYAVFADHELAEFHARHSPVALMGRPEVKTE